MLSWLAFAYFPNTCTNINRYINSQQTPTWPPLIYTREWFLVSPSEWKAFSISSHLLQPGEKCALCQQSRDLPQPNVCHLSALSVCHRGCCPKGTISRPLCLCLSSHCAGQMTSAGLGNITYHVLFLLGYNSLWSWKLIYVLQCMLRHLDDLRHMCQTDPVKGCCGCRFSFQPSKNTSDLDQPTNQPTK